MSPDTSPSPQLEIGHVLFIDIVGYSKLLTNEQRQLQQQLNQIVRETDQFRAAEAAGKLVRLPTGDGMALAFFNSPDAPLRCAMAIAEKLKDHPQLKLRMGVHSGPVDVVFDVNDRPNVAGAGINMAQRVMDCGDAGHILLSKRSADDLSQYGEWKVQLHELGEMEVKHGLQLPLVNFYNDAVGNPEPPERLKREEEAKRAAVIAAKRRNRRRVLAAAAAVTLLVVAIGGGSWIWHHGLPLTSTYTSGVVPFLEKGIAVLPFENFDGNKENAYFADGVQDDILTDLVKVADLKVISRRSVAQYRDTKKSIREIGQALRVAHVLEGSVRKSANKIHVTAQLMNTRTEAPMWAEKYDRDLADVFSIQSEISQMIVTHLKAALSPAEKASIEKIPTRDMAAYDLYLRGKQLFYNLAYAKDQKGDLSKVIDLLNQAIGRDRDFALAYCLQAQAHITLFAEFDQEPAHLEQARSSAETALRLAADSGEAHFAQGYYFYHGLHDADRALSEFAIAARTLPNNSDVLAWTGILQRRLGRWRDALHNLQKATDLDPYNAAPPIDLVITHELLRNYAEADRIIDRSLSNIPQVANRFRAKKAFIALKKGDTKGCEATLKLIPPDYDQGGFIAYLWAQLAFYNRDYARATAILAKVPKEESGSPRSWVARQQAFVAQAQGDIAKAKSALLSVRAISEGELREQPNDPHALSWLALWDAGLGRREDAIRESQKAIDLQSISPDPANETDLAERQALVYAWSGERDRALQQLERLAKIPSDLSPGDLKLNPGWDSLRKDPRFDKLVAEAAKPVKLN
jgi:TolB-like protein/Tfp pilus assembly protein PilF